MRKEVKSILYILPSTITACSLTSLFAVASFSDKGLVGGWTIIGLTILIFNMWGHFLAAPGILVYLIRIAHLIENKKDSFVNFCLASTLIATSNGLMLLFFFKELRNGNGAIGFAALFASTGLLTGILHWSFVTGAWSKDIAVLFGLKRSEDRKHA